MRVAKQEHFVVGNMWFPYAVDLASLTLGIQRLKKNYGFKSELHFTEINSTKLPFYKQLASFVGEEANTYSFKAIGVERRGVGKGSDAFRDLYYRLLLEGVKHEVQGGRALLPRKLQLLKDAEEPGSDKLLLRLVGGSDSKGRRRLLRWRVGTRCI